MNIPFDKLKTLFSSSIDAILAENGLSVECTLKYNSTTSNTLCPNCIYDSISRLSSGIYNNVGPIPFTNGTVCPVCEGQGTISSSSVGSKDIYLVVIFDSKYFINIGENNLNIPTGSIQTICHITLIKDILNSDEITVDKNIAQYGNYSYVRAEDPRPVGFGENKYISTIWTRTKA